MPGTPAGCRRTVDQDTAGAFVVMLVPELLLTSQQAAVFANSGFSARGWSVEHYNAERQLDISGWGLARQKLKVAVMTPQVGLLTCRHSCLGYTLPGLGAKPA